MMKDWKIIVISATLAFTLSVIFGFFGRVSFGILLIRALAGAVLFGVAGFGASFLFRRYLPELYELQAEPALENSNDLKVAEGIQNESGDSDIASSTGAKIDISIDDGDENIAASIMKKSEAGYKEESEEGNQLVDEVTDNDQVPGNIDVLPDMGVFSNSFENEVDDVMGEATKAGAVTLDIMGEEQDPELVVRAVRTMVKKDQEG